MKKLPLIFLIFAFLTFSFYGCKKSDNNSTPAVTVTVNLMNNATLGQYLVVKMASPCISIQTTI